MRVVCNEAILLRCSALSQTKDGTAASERTARQESEDGLSHLTEKAAEDIASKKDNTVSVFHTPHHLERPPRYSWHMASCWLIFVCAYGDLNWYIPLIDWSTKGLRGRWYL